MKSCLIIFMLLISNILLYSQTNDCSSAIQFCSGINFSFPANTSTNADVGPDYGCLGSQPNPTWFYFEVVNAGSIVIDINNSNSLDIDYICWGPFSSMTNVCNNLYNVADCDYTTASANTLTITSAQTAEFYIIMVTNYSAQYTDITIAPNSSSTGSTAACRNGCPVNVTASQSLCETGSVSFGANVFTSDTYTFNWYGPNGYTSSLPNNTITNFSASNAGSYTLIATAGTCISSDTMSLNMLPLPTPGNFYSVNNNTITFTNTSTNATSNTYWNFGDNSSTFGFNPTHTYSAPGIYTIIQTEQNNCGPNTYTFTVTIGPVSVNNLNLEQIFQIGTNPINESLIIETKVALKDLNVKLYNISGELIINKNLKNPPVGQVINYNAENLSPGIYILELNAGEKLFTKKIVKN